MALEEERDPYRTGGGPLPSRLGHSAQGHGGGLRRFAKDRGVGPPSRRDDTPHTHAREDECSFVLEGEMMCYVGGEIVLAQKGSYVIKPRGVPHAFYNSGAVTVRVMEILTPGGEFEGYFDEYEEIVSRQMSDEEHRRARADLGERYGITWHDERIPEVEASFGLAS